MRKKNTKQQGSLLLVIVPVIAVLLLIAMGAVWWTMTHQKKAAPAKQAAVSVDDALTNGNTNADLTQDVRILSAATDRNGKYVSATNDALNDQAETVLN